MLVICWTVNVQYDLDFTRRYGVCFLRVLLSLQFHLNGKPLSRSTNAAVTL